jgi:TonB family protein
MKKYWAFFCLLGVVFLSIVHATDQDDFIIKSRLFKSIKQETNNESDVVVSLFSVPVLIPYHPNYVQLEKVSIHRLKNELQKIYKIENIDHLASGFLVWDGNKDRMNGIIMVKESSYPLLFSPRILGAGDFNLRVQISQPRNTSGHSQSQESLLDTEMVLRANTPYVLGFPYNDHKYFLSVSIAKRNAGKFEEEEYSEEGPEEDIPEMPTLIHKVIPVYPARLKKENIGGKVILQLSVDKKGTVTQVKALNVAHPELIENAISAVRQWQFEPILKKNKPRTAKFPVVVDFRAQGSRPESYSSSALMRPSLTD